jgi:hypothetical protein
MMAAGDVACKTNKGLKSHKKALKEKVQAKRAAAAQKTYAKKASSAPVTAAVIEETALLQEEAAGNVESTSIVSPATRISGQSESHRDESYAENSASVTIEAQKDVTATENKTTTNVGALVKFDGKDSQAMDSQSRDEASPPTSSFELVATGSKDCAPTKVGAVNRTEVERGLNDAHHFKTDVSRTQNITQFSMLNPTAKVFQSEKVVVAQTPPQDTSTSDKRSLSESLTKSVMAQEEPFDIVAYRKSLETALYENMETPRQRLIRCKFTISIDTEFHPKVEDDEYFLAFSRLMEPTLKCLDDCLFEITPIKTGLTEADLTVQTTASPSSSLCEIFTKVSDLGVSKVGAVKSGERKLESVEAEMRLAAENRSSYAPAFADPGIVRYTINRQNFDNVGNPISSAISTTGSSANQANGDDWLLQWLKDQSTTSPPDTSPGSSRNSHSQTSSLIDGGRSPTPLTRYTNPSSPVPPVWSIPYSSPYVNMDNAHAYGPGIPMAAYAGDFHNLGVQQHAPHPPAPVFYYGGWDAYGNWIPHDMPVNDVPNERQ